MIRSTKVKLGSQGFLEDHPKLSSKHPSTIRYNPLRHAMQPHNLTDENSRHVRCLICHTHRNKVGTLHQSVYHHKNRVVSPCRQGQSNNKIPRNDFPFRFWNVMWLKSYKPFMTPTTLLSHLLHCVHSPYINTITTQASSSQLQASTQASKLPHAV